LSPLSPLPSEVKAVLAQRLFIEKTGLPAPLLNQLKRLAAFQNLEFYKKQRMRLSTAMTSRVITCAEDLAHHISLPRSCIFETKELLEVHGVALMIDDQGHGGAPLELKFNGELTGIQKVASRALLVTRRVSTLQGAGEPVGLRTCTLPHPNNRLPWPCRAFEGSWFRRRCS
jgi:hypothetical protein